MIERYTLPEMKRIWTEKNRFQQMLEVEIACAEAMAEAGLIPKVSAARIRRKASFKIAEIHEIEKVTKHDVTAFLKSVGKTVGPDARFVHKGLTSSDVVDTGFALQILPSIDLVARKTHTLREALKVLAVRYAKTPAMGRTHGIHAEPTTFGLKLLLYYEEFGRHLARLAAARENIRFGKLSGAVGTHASLGPRIEEAVMRRLNLNPAPVSTQVLQRDRHAEVLSALALLGASLEKLATEIRHLQRTEVREAEEGFSEGQTGSSAMPHKKNPVNCERVAGLARVLRGNLVAGIENVALWHERDISHSSVERVIFPDSFALTDFMLEEMTRVLKRLKVYPERMMANIRASRGLFFSQRLLLRLIDTGYSRFDAYAVVQELALKVWNDAALDLQSLSRADERVRKVLSKGDLDSVFDLGAYLKHVDAIFARSLGGGTAKAKGKKK